MKKIVLFSIKKGIIILEVVMTKKEKLIERMALEIVDAATETLCDLLNSSDLSPEEFSKISSEVIAKASKILSNSN